MIRSQKLEYGGGESLTQQKTNTEKENCENWCLVYSKKSKTVPSPNK
jgi:hypothetical protein